MIYPVLLQFIIRLLASEDYVIGEFKSF